MLGPGKYDAECTAARESAKAMGCLLMIVQGDRGSGFSCQVLMPEITKELPAVLRTVADQIEKDTQ